ncbi:hypothetical protein E0H73_33885 [Kribbella pittospori]|uniref:Secreted protein n=1 Tax=Kribbella pittospori TaxID=722689 RepID=A0A4R0K8Z3_9ACTN|nr:hypothetical protein [Kribbella pittospori]TCC56149.1 hypothetical protein E0H73_33885 [Kribbella pittospori]
MKSYLGRVVAGSIALAAATTVLTVGHAFASEPPDGIVWDHTYRAEGVVVYVEEHGDIVSVCDTAANGHSAWVRVQDRVGYEYRIAATHGKGTCDTAQASDGGGRNLYEGDRIGLEYEGNGDTFGTWAEWVNDH